MAFRRRFALFACFQRVKGFTYLLTYLLTYFPVLVILCQLGTGQTVINYFYRRLS